MSYLTSKLFRSVPFFQDRVEMLNSAAIKKNNRTRFNESDETFQMGRVERVIVLYSKTMLLP